MKDYASVTPAAFFTDYFTSHALKLYNSFYKKDFPKVLEVPAVFHEVAKFTYEYHKQSLSELTCTPFQKVDNRVDNDKDAVVAFSCGLDSLYEVLWLLDNGYTPHLVFVSGLNKCEGNFSITAAREFANRLNLDLVEAHISRSNKEKSDFFENPARNLLIKSICLDYAIENGWNIIASGEDTETLIAEIPEGLYFCDTAEYQKIFQDSINNYSNGFCFLNTGNLNKMDKLKYVSDRGMLDYYYSCTNMAANFAQHKRNTMQKFNITHYVPKWNCTCCRKCTQHMIFLHELGVVKLSAEYEKYCWDKVKSSKMNMRYDFNLPKEELLKIIGD